ncbi:MAG: glycosyltransferase [Phycisphaeraceae bacterium]|nr:glycosyltransferase [Phycisphaeraceae bacterium]
MRIVHVIGSLDPSLGGPPMVVGCLAAAQAQLGAEVHIVAYDCPDQEEVIHTYQKTIPDFSRITLGMLRLPDSRERYSGKQALSKITEHLTGSTQTVVHLHGIWETILRQAAKAAKSHAVAYIIAPHGMLHPWSMSQRKWKKKVAMKLGYRKMLKSATAIHALNHDEAKHIRKMGFTQSCQIIPNGVFLNEIQPLPAPGSFVRNTPQLQGKPYILFLSRLHFKKGLDRLLSAFNQIAHKYEQVQLVIAGPDGGYEQTFRNQINKLDIAPRVHLVGPLWDKSKYAAMQDAVCFCLPSRQEGFSVAITEALAVGVPAVISDACCFDEVVHAHAGYVVTMTDDKPQESITSLANTLECVLASQPNHAMRQAGRKLIEAHYTWPVIAKQSLQVYEQMIGTYHV